MKSSLLATLLLAVASVLPAFADGPAPTKDNATHVDPAAASKLVEEKKVQVLDVRTPGEFSLGHIPGAQNVDFNSKTFESSLSKLDKDQPYLVHCGSGGRSTSSLATFQKLGFTHIYHLDGGLTAWKKDGKPVVK